MLTRGQMEKAMHRHSPLVGAYRLFALCILAGAALAGCGGGSGTEGTQVTVSGAEAPQITSQPQNTTVASGKTATFSITATGTAPMSYQWMKNSTAVSGATSASYTTPATSSSDNGASFTVAVSNSAGSITSNAAILTVTSGSQAVAPQITAQPQNSTVTAGQTATFSVTATGTAPLAYQWMKNTTVISGATSASYTTPATSSSDNGATFGVQVSNVAGSTTSNAATLTVTAAAVAPTITTQPQNQTVTVGATATFTVVAAGTLPLSYQWSKDGTAIAGATSASYATPAAVIGDNGSTFSVKVSNVAGSMTSNTATLTVKEPSGSGAPIMFQHIASSTDPVGNGISGRAFTFYTESLPPNSVAVMGVSAPASNNVTISDTLVGSWSSAVCAASGGTGNVKAYVFVQSLGATGGADTITIDVGSSNTQPVQFDITFWENISTSSPANGSLCTGSITPGSGGSISPGSFTPTTNNDANGGNVIWNYTPNCTATAGGNPTRWVPASGFSLLNGDIIWTNNQGFPEASQYYVQATQASVTPSITATGDTADCFNSTSVALMVANNSATAPPTIHVASILHESFVSVTTSSIVVQTPTVGNLRVIGFPWQSGCIGGGTRCVTDISSSDGCSWILVGGTGGNSLQGYAQNCSACPTCTTTMTISGSGASIQSSFRFYDIDNAASSSYQNSTGNNGACSAPTVSNAPGSFTPSGAANGLTIATIGNGNGPITGMASGSPTGATFDLWTFTGQTDTDLADNADGQAHYYYSSTATQTWNWMKTNTGDSCYWWASNYN